MKIYQITIGRILLLLLAVIAPFIATSFYEQNILITMLINGLLATGLAIVVRAGRLSLAQATFGGIGGYTAGILGLNYGLDFWTATLVGAAVAAAFGVVLGITSIRLKGFYFVIATFAFSLLMGVLLVSWKDVTGGLTGIFGVPLPEPILGFKFEDNINFYFLLLIILIVTIYIYWLCSKGSKFGRALSALGEDELLAAAIGVNPTRYRLVAFAISSFIAGIAGSLNGAFIGGVTPSDVAPVASIFVLVMVLAGDAKTLMGPVVGAIILTVIPELLRVSAQWLMVSYGVFLLLYVYLFPGGILPPILKATGSNEKSNLPAFDGYDKKNGIENIDSVNVSGGGVDISFTDISCSFGDITVLQKIDFSVPAGQFRGIIGPNGAGKTTLFNLITGYVKSSGHITFDGDKLTPFPSDMAHLGVGRTFQKIIVFADKTVMESINLSQELSGNEVDKNYIDWVIKVTGLSRYKDVLGSDLSQLNKRLLTLAMAIAGKPKLLLLDEPLAGLDDTETQLVKTRIQNIHESLSCTILMIEHKLSVVMELCECITVIDRGIVIAEGEPSSVATHPEVIRAYLGDNE